MTDSEEIDAQIKQLGDWRGETLARVREIIKRAEPDVVEDGAPTGATPGIVLRSGRDTDTVTAR